MFPRNSSALLLIFVVCLSASALPGKGDKKGKKKDPCVGGGWGVFGREVPASPRHTPPLRPFDIHYEEHGKGNPETIVLIHGLDSITRTWDPIVAELAKKYHVVVYDQRGHGQSAARGTDYSAGVMASDLQALMDHLDI